MNPCGVILLVVVVVGILWCIWRSCMGWRE